MKRNGHRALEAHGSDDLRAIRAGAWKAGRFQWLGGVRHDHALTATARLVAHELALEFANSESARCNPSFRQLAAGLGASPDTIKRAVRELVQAGWLAREPGRRRGQKGAYLFLARAVIVPISEGRNAPTSGVKPGAGMPPLDPSNRGQECPRVGAYMPPPYNIAKPYKNHEGGHAPEMPALRPSENPQVIATAERAVAAFRAGRSDALADAPPWVQRHVIAAGLLTDAERAVAGLALPRKGSSDE